MGSGRFNWIVLLCGAILVLAVGAVGLLAGAGSRTLVFFAFGLSLAVGSVVLSRRRER